MNFEILKRRFVLLSCLALPGVLAGCGGGESEKARETAQETIKEDAKTAKSQLDELKGVTLKGSELSGGDNQGRPLWRVSAKEIRIFNEGAGAKDGKKQSTTEALTSTPKRAELVDATAMLYREGKPDSSFRAPKIILNQSADGVRLTMTGGVRAESRGSWSGSRGPVVLTAPQAEVNVKARRIFASKGVRLVQGKAGDQINVAANQVSTDTNLKSTVLSGGVKAAGNLGTFSAKQATWNWETDRASAKGDIIAKHEETTIRGSQLDADTRAGRGVLRGAVSADGEQGKATAQSVRYDWKAGTLLASGGVVLTKEEVSVRAGTISSDDKFNRATASGSVTLTKAGATLKAGRIETSGKGTQATASGGVLLTRDGATLSASRATAHNIGTSSARVEANGDVRVKREDVTITANRATASGLGDKSTLRVVASGGVTATNKDGTVRAGSATYGGGKIVASNGVTLLKDGHRLTGSRLTTDEKFTLATLSGNVNGRLAKGETIGAGVLVYRKGAGVEGRNGVTATRGDLRLRADKLTATPDGNNILLTGNVVVTNPEGATIRSASARYDRVAEKVYATGEVFFTDPKRGLKQRGRGLVADLRLKEATLTGVSGSGKMDVFKDKKLFN